MSTLAAVAANPLPASRTPGGHGSWTNIAGIPGGIPIRSTIFTNFSPGATLAQINNGIALCPSNQVVHLSAGTYIVNGSVTIVNNGVTLRGDTNSYGQPTTIISNNVDGSPMAIGFGNAWYNDFSSPQAAWFHAWTNGYLQGTNIITLSNTTSLVVGQLCYLDQLNDADTTAYSDANPDGPYVTGEYSSLAHPNQGYDRIQFQVNRIAAIAGNQVTLQEPIYMPNWSATYAPELWAIPNSDATLTVMLGIENISFFTDGQSDNPNAVSIVFTANCWAANCWAAQHETTHAGYFWMVQSLRPEIRHCYLHDATGVADRYGIQTRVTAGALITDNIASGNIVMCMINGVSGSVYSYNYAFTNIDQGTSGFVQAGLYTHGGTPNMVLMEGNETPQVQLDSQWQNTAYMTVFRNRLPGVYAVRTAAGSADNIQAIVDCATNRHASIIGNVLGRSGIDTHYEISGLSATPYDHSRVYYLGYLYVGSAGTGSNWDLAVTNTLIRAVNWTSATTTNNGITLDGFTTNDLPASLFLTSKPANWGNCPWPAIDPTMGALPDQMTNTPAAYRMNVSYVNNGPGLTQQVVELPTNHQWLQPAPPRQTGRPRWR